MDLDVFVELAHNTTRALISLDPIYEYLAGLEYSARHEYIVIEAWPVQFLVPGDLAAIALKTGRPKDFTRLMQFLEGDKLDRNRLQSIIEKHGLGERWQKFCQRFLNE